MDNCLSGFISFRNLAVLSLFYIIPLISVFTYNLRKTIKYTRFHSFLGHIEWALSFPREYVLSPFVLIYIIYLLIASFVYGFLFSPLYYLWLILFPLSSVWALYLRKKRLNQFIKWIADNPIIEPAYFFRLYYSSYSLFPGKLKIDDENMLELPLIYAKGKTKQSYLPLLSGLIDTGILAGLIIKASRNKDDEFCRKLAEKLSAIWGARLAELAECRVYVRGLEKIDNLKGRLIFACNHKSFTDFAFTSLIFAMASQDLNRDINTRYMAAKNHFIENRFLHDFIGMGKAMEAVGTIFVERKSERNSAISSTNSAVKAIVKEDADLVIFPQGTRAYGNSDRSGRRIAAGYYTTLNEKSVGKEMGHLKKGVAYITVDSALGLSENGTSVNVVPVGLIGTGMVASRGSYKIQKGIDVTVIIGDPLSVTIPGKEGLIKVEDKRGDYLARRKDMIEEIYHRIDTMLKETLNVHGNLKKRLTLDTRNFLNADDFGRFMELIEAWSSEEDLIFSIIDCIYTLPSEMWIPNLRRLYQLLEETDIPRNELFDFKRGIAKEMIRKRK